MTCPNCGSAVVDNAHFCQNCGYRFDEVRPVEPIRININPRQTETPNFVAPSVQSPVVVRETKSSSTGAIIALTILATLIVIGGLGLFAYYLLSRPASSGVVANANAANANLSAVAISSPTTYDDLRNKLAPPDKRSSLMDEQFNITVSSRRTIEFTVDKNKGARLVGGLRVTRGKAIDFSVYRSDVDGESPSEDLKPLVQELRTRNKIVNYKLQQGNYALVFENKDELLATVAAEFFLVFN